MPEFYVERRCLVSKEIKNSLYKKKGYTILYYTVNVIFK